MTWDKGISLIAVVIVMLLTATLALLVASTMSTGSRAAIIDMQAQQAFYVAEAGLENYIYLLKDGTYDETNHPGLTKNLGNGSYSVTSSYDAPTSVYTLTSTGTVDTATRVIVEAVAITSEILNRAIHADGSNVTFARSTGTINGDISCFVSVSDYSGMTINGNIINSATKINPTLNYDYYKGLAQAQGRYSTSNLGFAGGTYTGVWYTTKKATIGNNAVINGSIITEGSIEFNGKANNVQISPSNNYPALATMGSISSSDTGSSAQRIGLQNSTINGLVMAGSNVTFDYVKNSTFNGTMLAGNNIQMRNGAGILVNYNAGIFTPMTPGFTYTEGDATVVQQGWNETF